MCDDSTSLLELNLHGLSLSCRLDGQVDRRLLKYLCSALDEALDDEAPAAQAMEWRVGDGCAALSVSEQCGRRALEQARAHLTLFSGDQGAIAAIGPGKSPSDEAMGASSLPQEIPAHGLSGPVFLRPSQEGAGDDAVEAAAFHQTLAAGEPFESLEAAAGAVLEVVARVDGGQPEKWLRRRRIVEGWFGLDGGKRPSLNALGRELKLSKQGISMNFDRAREALQDDRELMAKLNASVEAHAEVFLDWFRARFGGAVACDAIADVAAALDHDAGDGTRPELAYWQCCLFLTRVGQSFNARRRQRALADWLASQCREVKGLYAAPGIDGGEVSAAAKLLAALASDWRLPLPLDFVADQVPCSPESLNTALHLQKDTLHLRIEGNTLTTGRTGVIGRRLDNLRALMIEELAGCEASLAEIAARYADRFPDDAVPARTIYLALADARGGPHLFTPAAATEWRAAGVLPDAGRRPEVRMPTEPGDVPDTYKPTIELLRSRGPLSNLQITDAAKQDKRSAGGASFAIHQSGFVVRVGPRIFGLPEHLEALARAKQIPEAFLEADMLMLAAYGVRTGEAGFLFPCWSEVLERSLRRTASAERETDLVMPWRHIADSEYDVARLFGAYSARPALVARKTKAVLALSAAQHVIQYGRLSPAGINVLSRTRVEPFSIEGVAVLTGLTALGILDGRAPWSEAQGAGPLVEEAINKLSTAMCRVGDLDWQQPECRAFLDRARSHAKTFENPWLDSKTAEQLVVRIGG